ncbi:MAG: Pr6Pr family membrane protein [Proteobacteria bacterium]|nr:Pr6Pr family membrane protein [Pseudomonadota bacterium]
MPTPQRNDFRLWYARVAAATAWFALLLQFWLSIELSRANGKGVWHAVWMYFAFFTILTNLLAAAALATAASRKSSSVLTRPDIVTGIAASIVLVGIAYNLLLRNFWNPHGLQLLADITLHDLTPPLFLGWWWLSASAQPLRYAAILRWMCYPIAYFAYAMARGAVDGFYPYPFVDVPELGIARVLANALAILAGFIAVAALLVALARFRAQRAHA